MCRWVKSGIFLGMIIPPSVGNPYMRVYKPHPNWVDDHPLLYRNKGEFRPQQYVGGA